MRLMNRFFKSNFVDSDSNGISYTLLDQVETDGCHLNADDEDLFPDRTTSGSSRSHIISFNVSIAYISFCLCFCLSVCIKHMVTLDLRRWRRKNINNEKVCTDLLRPIKHMLIILIIVHGRGVIFLSQQVFRHIHMVYLFIIVLRLTLKLT